MKTIYIKENTNDEELIIKEKLPNFIKKISIKIIKKFNIIGKRVEENDVIYTIPNVKNKNSRKKLKDILENENKNLRVVYSNEIKKITDFNVKQKVLNGKQILLYMTKQVLDYIINIDESGEKLELQDIYILQNDFNFETITLIEYLIDKVKSINIITNQISKYRNIEEKLYERGYAISISNNKKKALRRARIILNMNFTKEDIVKFNINRDAILINYTNEKLDKLVGFDGIIINKIQINIGNSIRQEFKDRKIFIGFNEDELYESMLGFNKFLNQINRIRDDKIQIEGLIGNNGKISEKEIILKKKLLTNTKN